MQAWPIVTVVTPSLNQGRFIEQTIRSVLVQDYPAIEYLVLDGGSTDQTLTILRHYEGQLRWVSEHDGGQSEAIQRGFAQAQGEILTWLNADDRFVPGAVRAAVTALLQQPDAALLYGNAEYIDETGRSLGACWHIEPFNFQRLLTFGDYIVQPAAFFRRAAYEAVGGIDSTLSYCMDYDLWIRLAFHFPVIYLQHCLAQARLHPTAKTATGGLARLDEIERVVQRYGQPRLPASHYPEMIVTAASAAAAQLRAGQGTAAVRTLLRGFGYGLHYSARRLRYGRTWQR